MSKEELKKWKEPLSGTTQEKDMDSYQEKTGKTSLSTDHPYLKEHTLMKATKLIINLKIQNEGHKQQMLKSYEQLSIFRRYVMVI